MGQKEMWERKYGDHVGQNKWQLYRTEVMGILWNRIYGDHVGQKKWQLYGTETKEIISEQLQYNIIIVPVHAMQACVGVEM
jgi:hypothetical protein